MCCYCAPCSECGSACVLYPSAAACASTPPLRPLRPLRPRRWYGQAGTPRLSVTGVHNPSEKTYTLRFSQVRDEARPVALGAAQLRAMWAPAPPASPPARPLSRCLGTRCPAATDHSAVAGPAGEAGAADPGPHGPAGTRRQGGPTQAARVGAGAGAAAALPPAAAQPCALRCACCTLRRPPARLPLPLPAHALPLPSLPQRRRAGHGDGAARDAGAAGVCV